MSRILIADDSPHAQRMGERILREEGFEVATVTDGETALLRLSDVDPDVILADVSLPLKSGYELCEHVKAQPEHCHRRVVLLAGPLEAVDEGEAVRVGADGVLRKPLEASTVLAIVRPLATVARGDRVRLAPLGPLPESGPPLQTPEPAPEEPPAIDPEKVRAAVTLAVDAATPALIEELTVRVVDALRRSYGPVAAETGSQTA